MTEVALEWYEVLFAANVGLHRRVESIRRGSYRPMYQDGEDEWTVEEESACAEMAFAKHADKYWSGSVNAFKDPDVGAIQIRHTFRRNGRLIIREADRADHFHVLVVGRSPTFHVLGGMYAEHARQQEAWLADPGGRGQPACFVPQSHLRPLR